MNEESQDVGQELAKWNFREYDTPPRKKSWYVWSFLIFAFFLIYSLVTVNFLFAIIIIIGGVILLLREKYEPIAITFAINEDGIQLDGKFYAYDQIKQFYIIYKPPQAKDLYFDFKAVLKPRLMVPLENQNPLEIREMLIQYLDENLEREDEPASEAWRKTLGL